MICAVCLVPCASLCWRPPGGPFNPPGNRLVQMGVMVVLDGMGDEKYLPVFIMSQSHSLLCALCPVLSRVWDALICTHSTHGATALTGPTSALAKEGRPALRQDGSALSRHNGSPWRKCLSRLKRPTARTGCAAALTTVVR